LSMGYKSISGRFRVSLAMEVTLRDIASGPFHSSAARRQPTLTLNALRKRGLVGDVGDDHPLCGANGGELRVALTRAGWTVLLLLDETEKA